MMDIKSSHLKPKFYVIQRLNRKSLYINACMWCCVWKQDIYESVDVSIEKFRSETDILCKRLGNLIRYKWIILRAVEYLQWFDVSLRFIDIISCMSNFRFPRNEIAIAFAKKYEKVNIELWYLVLASLPFD